MIKKNIKVNIMTKLVLFSFALTIGVVFLGVGLGYFWASDLLRNSVGKDNIERSLHTLFSQGLGLTGILILLAILLSFLTSRLFTRPIKKLYNAAEEIGKGDLSKRVDIKTGDEIEELGDSLNNMAERLEAFSKTLEKRVEERTRDLEQAKEELERANTELKKLDELKSDFISTVSHDLRTPLSITKEGINLILDGIAGEINDRQKKILITSKNNIDRITRIINSLLDISKIEAGRLELKKTCFDIVGFLNQIADSFGPKIEEKDLKLKLDLPNKGINIYADPDRLAQVFTNLMDNAVKFTQKGQIEISCADKEDVVECAVSDTGIGIAAEDIPKVFGKFQNIGRPIGEKGAGLGLSIVKGIIEMHHGNIGVESLPGRGSRFFFTLPKITSEE